LAGRWGGGGGVPILCSVFFFLFWASLVARLKLLWGKGARRRRSVRWVFLNMVLGNVEEYVEICFVGLSLIDIYLYYIYGFVSAN